DREGEHPERDHRGEIERRDPGNDADRKPDELLVDPCRNLIEVRSAKQRRCATRHLHDLETAADLAAGLIERLAVLPRDGARELLDVLLEDRAEPEHHRGAVRDRRLRPCRECLARRLDRATDLLAGGVRKERDRLAGGRVGDRFQLLGPRLHESPADEHRDPVGHPDASSTAASIVSIARAASSSVITSGGEIRSTLPYRPPRPISSPRSLHDSITRAARCGLGSLLSESSTSSTPIIRPLPRTSPTTSYWSSNGFSPSIRNL